ncbi:unnamed protein product [Blepharisma stoltei]|uniref:Uncharacterized protein n=1 Tax=Blepharisma stoltei TaxID=1481888 RepID=A0AAU9IFY7_9CILI|nr:unnamed protein product [Blepharisma stoltei]
MTQQPASSQFKNGESSGNDTILCALCLHEKTYLTQLNLYMAYRLLRVAETRTFAIFVYVAPQTWSRPGFLL